MMRVDWIVDGKRVSRRVYHSGSLEIERRTFDLGSREQRTAVDIEVYVHDPRSPLDAGHNEDFRRLGIMLRRATISRMDPGQTTASIAG